MDYKLFIGLVIGGGLGFLYNKKVGCATGTCPLTSSPFGSTIYGALIGLMIGSSI